MWIYPFRNYYLKSSLKRVEIHQKILDLTFLSDAGYRRKDENPRYFFGTASDELFSLQTIENRKTFIPYIEGEIKGIENEIYLFLNLKAWKYRRLYILFLLFALISSLVFIREIILGGTAPFQNMSFVVLTAIVLGLWFFILSGCYFFWKVQTRTLQFFLQHLHAENILLKEIPIVFRL